MPLRLSPGLSANWKRAETAGQDALIFMHTYPADLREGAERLGALLARPYMTCGDTRGRVDSDEIEPATPGNVLPARRADESDADSIGAWPRKGIPGGQLGPNRNGRTW